MAAELQTGLLVRLARDGDEVAFGELHRLFGPTVHAIVLARVSRSDADDLVQDVFMTAWQRLPSLRRPAAFGAWVARIARNRVAQHHRARRPSAPLPDDLAVVDAPTAEAAQALAAIRRLPPAYAETLMMRLVEGMTPREIAARLGRSSASVRVNLHRGMSKLRAELGIER